MAHGESVVAQAILGPTTGARGSQLVRVMLTDRGRLVAFKANTSRPLFSVNLDEVGVITTSMNHPFFGFGAPLFRMQLGLKDGATIGLQSAGRTGPARALATAIRKGLAGRGEH
jgi:hypothetical protein